MKRVYIETTIVSYLAAKPSRDLILAAHQEVTREWWERCRVLYDLCTSQFVVDEAGEGNAEAAAMYEDPIVEEVRRYRQARAAKFNYDIDAMVEDARKRQGTGGHKVLQPPKRKPVRRRKRSGSAAEG